jgi:hypothetical protein
VSVGRSAHRKKRGPTSCAFSGERRDDVEGADTNERADVRDVARSCEPTTATLT